MLEMAMFMLLIVPLPFSFKRKIFAYVTAILLHGRLKKSHQPLWDMPLTLSLVSFVSESPIVAKVQYYMKITFVFILILFIDSVNRVYRVQLELAVATESANKGK
jgi:B-cell receptor-associated protein 31